MASEVLTHHLSAQDFHDLPSPDLTTPQIWVNQVKHRAIVLGSRQRPTERWVKVGDAVGRGVEVARRRSGGGVVLIDPASTVWIDVLLPRDHPLWSDDVQAAFAWVGEAWAQALIEVGASNVVVANAGEAQGAENLCFAGVGAGEVLVGGHKVVGLSQRRWRDGARFQALATTGPQPLWGLDLLTTAALESYGGVAAAHALPVGWPFQPDAVQRTTIEHLQTALDRH